jgi:hypothetical protein
MSFPAAVENSFSFTTNFLAHKAVACVCGSASQVSLTAVISSSRLLKQLAQASSRSRQIAQWKTFGAEQRRHDRGEMSHLTSSVDFADFQSSSTQGSAYSISQGSENTGLLLSNVPSPQSSITTQSLGNSQLQRSTSDTTTLVLRPSVTVCVNRVRVRVRTFRVH